MANVHRFLSIVVATLVFGCVLAFSSPAAADHRWWAQDLVDHVTPENNGYGSPSDVDWGGIDGATAYSSYATCSGFIGRVLQQAYGYTDEEMQLWFGHTAPYASEIYDAIVAQDGFTSISKLTDVLPGDIIAIRYPDGASVSGHVVIVQSAPALRVSLTPLVVGASQYAVEVIDSTSSPHGPYDTRVNADGTTVAGAGIGDMRFYVNNGRRVVGHTWSLRATSTYRAAADYPVAIGRLQ